MAFDVVGKVDIDLQGGLITADSPIIPTKTYLPTEHAFRKAVIFCLQDFFRNDEVTSPYRWWHEDQVDTPTKNKIHIQDHFIEDERFFPCVIAGPITETAIPYGFQDFLEYKTDDEGRVWMVKGGGLNYNITISAASTKPGEEEHLKSILTFGLRLPVHKMLARHGYIVVPSSISPGSVGMRNLAGSESKMYWADVRANFTACWTRESLVNKENIESVTMYPTTD